MLFSGTLRFNLDPFDKHADDQLWNVLEVSHLKNFVSGLNEGLLHPIAEGGDNLRSIFFFSLFLFMALCYRHRYISTQIVFLDRSILSKYV